MVNCKDKTRIPGLQGRNPILVVKYEVQSSYYVINIRKWILLSCELVKTYESESSSPELSEEVDAGFG